jgi:hypothetical protein
MADKIGGAVIIDGVQVAETMQCMHCGNHWTRVPGSCRVRGFCRNCMGVLCGAEPCVAECRPFEEWLESVERQG